MSREITIVGAGGHGRVCADVASGAGYVVHGFADHDHELGDFINGYQCVANTFEDLEQHCKPGFRMLFIAINDNALRLEIFKKSEAIGFEVPTLIHPSAVVSPHATIENGTIVMPGAVVNANAHIGNCCVLNTGVRIEYDVVLADSVHVSSGAVISGGTSVGANSFVGTGASIIPGIRIGEGCLIGAGAAVTSNVQDGECVAGVPARVIRN